EIAPNHSVLIRVVEHQPEQVEPLAEVGGRVIAAIRRDRAARAAEAAAEAMLGEIRAGKSFAEVAEAHQLAVTEMPGMPRGMPLPDAEANKAMFAVAVPGEGKPGLGKLALADGRIAVFQVTKVIPGDLAEVTPEQRTTFREQLGRSAGNADVSA